MAYKHFHLKKGFTIIELIMVITIFSILASVALFNFTGFTDSINLSNLSQQIALYVKKAQTAGSLGKVPPAGLNPSTVPWKPTYGVHFSKDATSFCYFVDLDNSGRSPSDCLGEKIEQVLIQAGYQIASLCVKASPGTCSPVQSLDITFQRPNLSATILAGTSPAAELAEICIKSPKGKSKKIVVRQIGQISVEGPC